MARITIFSLDYDGCGEVLFTEQLKNYGGRSFFLHENLKAFLKEKASLRDLVELYVGSNRQSKLLDQLGAEVNKNGSCFKNYKKLCEDEEWTFRPLLLADRQNSQPVGTAIHSDNLVCEVSGDSKIEIIKSQLRDVAQNHPEDTVDFYFVDDDYKNILLPDLIYHFERHLEDLPVNVRLHVVKFDWGKNLDGSLDVLEERIILEHSEKSKQALRQGAVLSNAKAFSCEPKREALPSFDLSKKMLGNESQSRLSDQPSFLDLKEQDFLSSQSSSLGLDAQKRSSSRSSVVSQESVEMQVKENPIRIQKIKKHITSYPNKKWERLAHQSSIQNQPICPLVADSKKKLSSPLIKEDDQSNQLKTDLFNKVCRAMLTFGFYSPTMHVLRASEDLNKKNVSRLLII